MPTILSKVTVPAATAATPQQVSAWVDTDTMTNIAVGVKGKNYFIELHLGDDTFTFTNTLAAIMESRVTTVMKAMQIRVVNRSAETIEVEMFS